MSSSHSTTFTTFYNTINGTLRTSNTTYTSTNPATGTTLPEAPVASSADLDEAVVAANDAFVTWKSTTWKHRSELLAKLAALIAEHAPSLTDLLIAETGKPRFLAQAEIQIAQDTLLHFASLQPVEHTVLDENISKVVHTTFEPIGVVGAICPWNFPIAMPMNKLGPAIQAGNSIILKPSPFTPYTLPKICEIAQQLFPPGVIQCLGSSDDDESHKLGSLMTQHPGIGKISLTGSVSTGKKVMAACAGTLKRVTLELGGNDACIVCPDVKDIEHVAGEIVLSAFLNTGQVCVATKRVYIHEDVYGVVRDAIVKKVGEMKVGDGAAEDGVMVGPVQNRMQFEKVKGLVDEVKELGYEVLTTGEKYGFDGVGEGKQEGGYFLPLMVGPILPLLRWSSESEVVHWANDTPTGLSASVWSGDIARARRIAAQLDVGSVYINSTQKPSFQGLFGGHKESGIGVEFGQAGLLQYCNAKSTYISF
ncbi:aldehyde dehydrogenase [Aspergillus luchuensis]|uniref:aldehyde dehydrogenase (NAD(+)) n=1 Tax=Aspergillus kawachii TaxID=1069201 RepID=A0A146FFB0_ASPKA|nr:aldehyde dehydrogenase [Aspergillus luchuensis]